MGIEASGYVLDFENLQWASGRKLNALLTVREKASKSLYFFDPGLPVLSSDVERT